MIPIAAGGTELVFFAIMLAFGLINWLLGKLKAPEEPPGEPADPSEARPRRPGRPAPASPTEEERMRKFLEALGIPSDAPAPPPPDLAPQPRPVFHPRQHAPVLPPPLPRRAPQPRDEEEAPARSAATIEAGHLVTHELVEFDTVSSHVSAIPLEHAEDAPPAEVVADPAPSAHNVRLHAMLRSPDDLRAALLLREILGPPRGLQT